MWFRTWLAPKFFLGPTGLASSILGLFLASGLSAQTILTVNKTDDVDDGLCDAAHCSLREAITAANQDAEGGIISFNIPGAGPQTIQPLTALPSLTGNVIIDGTTQPGFTGFPMIELDGSIAGAPVDGLSVTGSMNLIRGLVVNRFSANGIVIGGGGQDNRVEGCFIGTDVTGTIALGNDIGVLIVDAVGNLIGGTSVGARNVISGNREGVNITGENATGNQIEGNYIGTNALGTGAVPNQAGVQLWAPDNTIGGTKPGSRNVISGNSAAGIGFGPPNSTGTLVAGNYIGVNASGTAALGNDIGVWLDNVPDNTIGGTTVAARNVISGNREGITMWDSGATGTLVQGNYVGTDKTGDSAIPNEAGIVIYGPANTIGGLGSGAGNLISGNLTIGVDLYGEKATGNMVLGNLIGINATGTAPLGNGEHGVALINAAGNTVGGTLSGTGNVLSGNTLTGVFLLGETTRDNVIQGNFIGTDPAGTTAMGNGESGIAIHSATNNSIGGTASGARNILSGNVTGILIATDDANGNVIQGNYIGTDVSGNVAIPNSQTGILLWSEGTIIGGTEAGAGNVISGNGFAGIDMGGGSSGATIQGNYIGTNAAGTAALGNDLGIFVNFSSDNAIGGTESGAGNVISGNTGDGLSLNGIDATGNVLQGNYIGTDFTGTVPLGNGAGLSVFDAPGNTLGGTQSGAGNVISGNAGNCITVSGITATGNIIQGNYFGTNAAGTAAVGNGGGFWVMDAPANTIGGTQPGAGNVISGNGGGIRIDGPNASGNVVQGNKIGTDLSGALPLGNGGAAVRFSNGAWGNTLGGPDAGAGNVIANGGWHGVTLLEDAGNGNLIRSNSIFDNGSLGIDLARGGVNANDDGDADTGPNGLQNYPVLTSVVSNGGAVVQATLNSVPNSPFTLEFFSNPTCDGSGFGEGKTPLGTATLTTDASGSGAATASFSSLTGNVLTATATDSDGNTSEFSQCGETTTLVLSPSPSNQTVTQGQSVLFTIAVTAEGGTFDETVALTCSGAPTQAACTLLDDEVTLVAGQATTTMTVTTAAPAQGFPMAQGPRHRNPVGWEWILLLAVGGLAVLAMMSHAAQSNTIPRRTRRRVPAYARWVGLAVLGGIAVLLQTSCGKDGTSPPTGGTPTGTYQLTVTATWQSAQTTANATLIVQ